MDAFLERYREEIEKLKRSLTEREAVVAPTQ